MSTVVTLHSYRGGTGKSTATANVATLMALDGYRVGVIDTDLQSPAMEAVFGVRSSPGRRSLVDYLIGRCEIEDAAYPLRPPGAGADVHLVPARVGTVGMDEIMSRGYDVGLLSEGFDRLTATLDLDVLLLDTHAGFSNETLTALASADALVVMTRADRLGLTGVSDLAKLTDRLAADRRSVVVNLAPGGALPVELRAATEAAYGAPLAAVLPYSAGMSRECGQGVFAVTHPAHPLAQGYRAIIDAGIAWSLDVQHAG